MGKKLKAGFVGAGFASRFHYDALCRVFSAEVEAAGVYSRGREKAEAFAAERSMKVFGSLEELIDACDVVHACVPPAFHEQVVVEALRRDRDVIVEKPFTGYFGQGVEDFTETRSTAGKALKRLSEASGGCWKPRPPAREG